MKPIKLAALAALTGLTAACASGRVSQQGDAMPSREAIAQIPNWCLNPPKPDATRSYDCGQATSRDMSIAINSAEADGRNKLAQAIQTEMQGLTERFASSVTGDAGGEEVLNTFRQAVRLVTNQTLSGSRVAQRHVAADPSGVSYRAFVLMELDMGAAKQALMNQVKQNDNLYARFRASQAFSDLDAEIKKIDEGRRAQQPPTSP
jgi:hypothetical protein